eukprot:jgi/Ulvmu1/3762/UM175_0010.1
MSVQHTFGFPDGMPEGKSRHLMQAGDVPASPVAAANITVVSSAAQFQAAVTAGAQDIVLDSHIDLAQVALAYSNDPAPRVHTALRYLRASTRSIR